MDYTNGQNIRGVNINFPIFLPDATRAVIRSLDNQDLINAGIKGLMVNGYHLMHEPGIEIIKKAGGIKKYINWDGLITSDSGGYQLFSLILRHKSLGKITKEGIVFNYNKNGLKQKNIFTPEQSIKNQYNIGSDIIMCLDYYTPQNPDSDEIALSVERTIEWAIRSKEEHLRQIKKRKLSNKTRPLIFAVIQGGFNKKLTKRCAKELIKNQFDGYGLGGWLFDENGKLDMPMVRFTTGLIPEDKLKFGLGVGKPEDIIESHKMGYHFFDCVLPTRDARHHRLYNFKKNPAKIDILNEKDIFEYVYINKKIFKNDFKAIGKYCDCLTCKNYSVAYLHHLFKIKDASAFRLATIHNLRTYSKLTELLRKD